MCKAHKSMVWGSYGKSKNGRDSLAHYCRPQWYPHDCLRQPEDTIKRQMYYDLGFEIDQTTGQQITGRLREVWQDYDKAKANLALSMEKIEQIYRERCRFIRSV